MLIAMRSFAIAAIVFIALIRVTHAQEAAPSPSPQESPNGAAATKPAPDPEADFWTQETMTGDWGGTRSRWKEKGIDLEFKLSNFVQGIASGGLSDDIEYTGKFEMTWKFDLGKVAGWKYWSSEIKTEFRFSGPLLAGVGGINPVNTAAITPAADGESVAITALSFTRLIPIDLQKGDLWAISFGRFNILDLIDEDFFGGAGLKDNIDLVTIGNRRPRAEHQLEAFYNLHITPWLRLTGDLQIVQPVRNNVDTAIVPGARLVMIF